MSYELMKNCSSGEDQSRTCLKCCAPSNSMMILYSGIQKSKGRWSSLLHPSCLDSSNGWDLVKGIANYFPEKFLAILEEVFPIVTSTAKNADVTKEALAIEVRFDLSKLGHGPFQSFLSPIITLAFVWSPVNLLWRHLIWSWSSIYRIDNTSA